MTTEQLSQCCNVTINPHMMDSDFYFCTRCYNLVDPKPTKPNKISNKLVDNQTTEQVLQSLIEELEEQKCVSKQLRGPFSHLRLTDELHNKTLDTAIQIIQARQSKLEEKDG